MQKVIIIGAGIGGLATSILLAKKGYQVQIFEKNDKVGGLVGRVKKGDFIFDMGPTYLIRYDIFKNFFHSIGEDIHQYLDFIDVPSTKYFFNDENYECFDTSQMPKIENTNNFRDVQNLAFKTYKNFEKDFGTKNLEKSDMYKIKNILNFLKLKPFGNYKKYLDQKISNEKIKNILSYNVGKMGIGLDCSLSHIAYDNDIFSQNIYPSGGIYKIIEVLEKLAKKNGVEIFLSQNVQNVIVEENIIKGVIVDGKEIFADKVVSNIDRDFFEQKFLNKNSKLKHYSPSGFLIQLGISKRLGNLSHHNIIFSPHFEKEMENLKSGKNLFHEPSVYICMPSFSDKNICEKNSEILSILVHTPKNITLTQQQILDYTSHIMSVVEDCIDEEITRFVVQKNIICINDFKENFNILSGSIYGLPNTKYQFGGFRPKNYSKSIKNLYYVGHTTQVGPGMASCLLSASLLSQRF